MNCTRYISMLLVATLFGCSAVTLGPEQQQQQKEDPIIARAPTPFAPERHKQLLGLLAAGAAGAALGAGGMWLWNNSGDPHEGEDPYHDHGEYHPPWEGFDPHHHGNEHHEWGQPHQGYDPNEKWGHGPDPHPFGHHEPEHHWGEPDHHNGQGHDPNEQPWHQNEEVDFREHSYEGNPYNTCDHSGHGFHDIHGNFFPPCEKDHKRHLGGFDAPRNFWSSGHYKFGDSTKGHGAYGNGFQPYGQGYDSAGCGDGQYCAQSNNKAAMFKADVNGTFTFPTCPNDEDCDSVVDGQDRCSRTLPRPKTYSADAWVWTKGRYAGCAAGQIRNGGDKDRDGVADNFDVCPDTPAFTTVAPSGKLMGCSMAQAPKLRKFVMKTITIYEKLLANKKKKSGSDAGKQLSD